MTGASPQIRDGDSVAFAHDRLRDAILRGEIPAGRVMSQVLLAKELGVSRTPLREAVRMLQSEGLVLVEPNRRIRIADFSLPDLEQLYAMRIVLESLAMSITVPVLQPTDLGDLEGLFAQMAHFERQDAFELFRRPHAAFHALLVSAAGERITSELSQLSDHAERYRLMSNVAMPGGSPARMAEHRAILDAVAAADIDLAVTRLIEHYAHTATLVLAHLDPDYDCCLLRQAIEHAWPAGVPGPAHRGTGTVR